MSECSNKNIHIFFKYVKGELTRKEEYSLDLHIQKCEECLFNFAYVEEIYTKKHLLSSDEKTLFLRYLSDPVWNSETERIKQEIRQEVNQEIVKHLVANQSKTNINPINTDKSDNKSDNKKYKSYSGFSRINKYLAAASVIVFAGLSTSIYLIIDKTTNLSQNLSQNLPISTPSLVSAHKISNNTSTDNLYDQIKVTHNKSITNNLYQELDLAIDQYLEHQDISFINKANDIATKIYNNYGDKYGVDLVDYYKTISKSQMEKLLTNRKIFLKISTQASGDNYEKHLTELQKLQDEFFTLGNFPEAYRVKTLTAKLQVKLLKYDRAKTIINDGINYTTQHKYLILKGYFLLWQAKNFSEISDYSSAENVFKETISIGKSLEIEEFLVSSAMTLSAIYLKNDDNNKALEMAQQVLKNYVPSNIEHTVSLLQIAGISAFNMKLNNLSEDYFQDAIKLSQKHSNSYALIMSYTFHGVTLAQSQEFEKAEEEFEKAKAETTKIGEKVSKLNVSSITLGYQAKAQLLAGKYSEAVDLYKETLAIVNQLEITNALELGQLEEGLAIALEKTGKEDEAKQHIATAKHYQQLADNKQEKANCLLSFIPNTCILTR